MTKTQNYQLSQWEPTDPIRRSDFNADNAVIDAALGAMGTELGALAASVGSAGNCRIAWGSYTGDGTYGSANPTKLEFDFKPVVVIIGSDTRLSLVANPTVVTRGRTKAVSDAGGTGTNQTMNLTWTETGLSWYCTESAVYQNNVSNNVYYYAVLGVTV